MKRVFRGTLPKGFAFFQNLLFALVEEDGSGIREYLEPNQQGQPDGQKFKVTIIIERKNNL